MKLIFGRPWIPSTPARLARSRTPVVHPKMNVNSHINLETKEWYARLLEHYVDQENIPMIQSMAVSPTYRRDIFLLELHQEYGQSMTISP